MWPEERRRELAQLRTLLDDCKAIDNATGVIERLSKISQLADYLTWGIQNPGHKSFLEFLIDESTRDE